MKQILIGLSMGTVCMCGWIAIFAQSGAQVNPPGYRIVTGPMQTEWVGYSVTVNSNNPMTLIVSGVELGLRDDGVVVWRKVKVAQ